MKKMYHFNRLLNSLSFTGGVFSTHRSEARLLFEAVNE